MFQEKYYLKDYIIRKKTHFFIHFYIHIEISINQRLNQIIRKKSPFEP